MGYRNYDKIFEKRIYKDTRVIKKIGYRIQDIGYRIKDSE